jgi:hypothetical protein
MLVLTHLLPSAIGLEWGLSAAECGELLSLAPSDIDTQYFVVPMNIDNTPLEFEFFF